MNTDRIVKQYLKSIQKELPFSYLTSKVILKEIRQAISESKVDHNWTLEELNSNFGTPAEIAASFQSTDTNKTLHKKIVKMRAVIIGVCIFVVFLITFVIILATTNGDNTYMTNFGAVNSH